MGGPMGSGILGMAPPGGPPTMMPPHPPAPATSKAGGTRWSARPGPLSAQATTSAPVGGPGVGRAPPGVMQAPPGLLHPPPGPSQAVGVPSGGMARSRDPRLMARDPRLAKRPYPGEQMQMPPSSDPMKRAKPSGGAPSGQFDAIAELARDMTPQKLDMLPPNERQMLLSFMQQNNIPTWPLSISRPLLQSPEPSETMEKLGQLQTALRAIESGQRLEAVDGVLVRQVLLQPRPQPQSSSAEPDTKGLYRDLLALRKASSSNAKAHLKTKEGAIAVENGAAASVVATTAASSPKRTKASRHHGQSVPETLQSTGSGSPERHGSSNNRPDTAEAMAAEAAHTTALLQTALATRGHELLRSEHAAALADAELRVELRRAEKLLPSKFLFERNLAGDRAIDAARQVLLRFQHRFYQLYFRHWCAATLELRLVAQRRAAAEIARVYCGHRARHQARLLRRERSVMADQRRQLLAFRIKFRGSQALKLQMAWRRFLWHRAATRRQQRQTAAKLLQRAFRTRQWRRQSLVSALADARRLVAAVSLQRLFRGHRARLTLQHTRPKPALVASELERRGAAFVIAYRGTFPYAMRRRWRSVLELLRRQRAARCVGAAVCRWFGVEARRQAARTRQLGDHPGSRRAAILIQKHVRRWLQQRKFLLAETSRKESAKRSRLAEKARRMELVGQHQASGRLGGGRKASPPRLSSLLPFAQLKKIGRGGGSPTEVGAARQRRLTAACRVQRWARQHYLLRLGLDRLLRLARKREEAAVFCDQSLRVCRQHAADGLAVQSLGAGLEEALRPLLAESLSPSKAKASPSRKKTLKLVKARPVVVVFPVLQLCFLVASGWKTPFVWREVDGKTLFQTKLERAKAVALLRSLRKRDATGAGSPTKGQQSPGSTSPSRRGPKTSAAKGAKPSDVFSPVDVDVALAKAMGGSKGALDFAAFLRVLGFLGELSLTQQPQQPQQPPRGSALCWGR
ncbi:hypothetical protein BBJ28_00025333, partial [Nothophytophthora sp. Chile5]